MEDAIAHEAIGPCSSFAFHRPLHYMKSNPTPTDEHEFFAPSFFVGSANAFLWLNGSRLSIRPSLLRRMPT